MAAKHESMDSASEDVSELSSLETSQIRLIGWKPKGKGYGAGDYKFDLYALLLNPAESIILRIRLRLCGTK